MSAAYDVATLLQQLSYGTVGTNIGTNRFMNLADNELAVFEFPGEHDTTTHGGGSQIEHPIIQVHVRHINPQTAYNTCYAIYRALPNQSGQTINNNQYDYFEPKQLPIQLNPDEKQRAIWMCEVVAHRKP